MGEILFLAHRMPFPANRGDKIRSHHLLMALARVAPVHVATFAETPDDRAQERKLARIAATHCLVDRRKPLPLAGAQAIMTGKPVSLTAFDNGRLHRWVEIALATRPIDTIVVFSSQMGQYIPSDFQGRVVIDLCDVDSAKFEAYADRDERRWINAREGRLLAVEEERLARRADCTLLVSDDEAGLFLRRLMRPGRANVRALRNGIDGVFYDPAIVEAHPAIAGRSGAHFVFTGQMDYAPNIAAVERFAERILPAIRNRHDAQFHIVGRAPTDRVRSLGEQDGVTVWGEVPDVRPFLAAATVVVAPLEIARGIQNKVLEAMAMARPVLATPQAATGIAARDGLHFLVRDDDAALIEGALQLIGNRDAAEAMGIAAREYVLRGMSWDAVYRELAQIVGRLPEACDVD